VFDGFAIHEVPSMARGDVVIVAVGRAGGQANGSSTSIPALAKSRVFRVATARP
jgi:hypothetical protein